MVGRGSPGGRAPGRRRADLGRRRGRRAVDGARVRHHRRAAPRDPRACPHRGGVRRARRSSRWRPRRSSTCEAVGPPPPPRAPDRADPGRRLLRVQRRRAAQDRPQPDVVQDVELPVPRARRRGVPRVPDLVAAPPPGAAPGARTRVAGHADRVRGARGARLRAQRRGRGGARPDARGVDLHAGPAARRALTSRALTRRDRGLRGASPPACDRCARACLARPKRNPCPRAQPNASSASRCMVVSTPSAIVERPRVWVMFTIAPTMVASSGSGPGRR